MAIIGDSVIQWNITDGSFKGTKFHVAIPKKDSPYGMMSQDITTERRLQISENTLVDGADIEDFGKKSRTFSAEIIFFGRNFDDDLKKFEDTLNEGTTGILILPDLADAVFAKFQRLSRKTNASEGNSTMLSVTWMEDRSKSTEKNPYQRTLDQVNQAKKQNDPASMAPSVLDKGQSVLNKAADASNALGVSDFINALASAENSITSARQSANAALNVPRNQRQSLLATVARANLEISSLRSAIEGLTKFTLSLTDNVAEGAPTRYNSGIGAIDYLAPDKVATQVVGGSKQVVTTKTTSTQVDSFEDAKTKLEHSIAALTDAKNTLEAQSNGAVPEFTTSSIQMINEIKDLIALIEAPMTGVVVTASKTSLLEVCFRNGLTVSDIDRVYKLNRGLDDILDIKPFTAIYL